MDYPIYCGKEYACKRCGHKKIIKTNHYFDCYGSVLIGNRCHVCMIEVPNDATVWECLEKDPNENT